MQQLKSQAGKGLPARCLLPPRGSEFSCGNFRIVTDQSFELGIEVFLYLKYYKVVIALLSDIDSLYFMGYV
ncbi:MAG: hypothetical protein CVV41_05930 [Candidatus Riflebacteria bacterium HGW-Riflebacteria-1]|nr:MAG: hypothetical protein CVV41_05930 [Candidatus Riflebacteria bacterium HGW-Riflebacteria-1]